MKIRSSINPFTRGFTLVEILVTIAIIGLLAAIAVPQYVKFSARAKRGEAYMITSSAHRAQLSYYAGKDHFFRVCPGGGGCIPANEAPALSNQIDLGLGTSGISHFGYEYQWDSLDSFSQTYELYLIGNILPGSGPLMDELMIGVNALASSMCAGKGWENGVPYLAQDQSDS